MSDGTIKCPNCHKSFKLKGTGGLYGFMPISESAARAEQAVRRSDTLASVAREVDELISIIRRVEGYDRSKEPSAAAVS